MITKHVEFLSSLTEEHQVAVLEAARRGLQDNDMLDEMDLADDVAFEIVEKLDKHMASPDEERIPFTLPTISVDRQAKKIAVCDEFSMVRPFRPYRVEETAIEEAKAWIAKHTDIKPQIVYPMVNRLTMSTGRRKR